MQWSLTQCQRTALPRVAAVIVVPSPPAGEGSKAFLQVMMGEGGEPVGSIPSPIRHCWAFVLPSPARGESAMTCAELAATLKTPVRSI